jgi:hypothetical protein
MYTDEHGRSHRYPPPANYIRPQRETFSAADDWARLVKRGLQFDAYRGHTSVRVARGRCLNPLVTAGDLLTVRDVPAGEPLVDGNLYIVDWDNADEVQKYRDEINVPSTEPILIAKFLRFICGEWRTQCRDSVARLDGVIVGMIVGVNSLSEVGDYNGAAHAGQIGDNAASQIVSNFSATGLVVVAYTGSTTTSGDAVSATILTTGNPVAVDASGSYSTSVGSGATFTSLTMSIYRDGSVLASGQASFVDTELDPGNFSFIFYHPVSLFATDAPAAGTHTYTLHLAIAGSGTGLGSPPQKAGGTLINALIKIREYKK